MDYLDEHVRLQMADNTLPVVVGCLVGATLFVIVVLIPMVVSIALTWPS